MLEREVIEDIAVLLRGFFATPMISSLGRLGVLKEMRTKQSFRVEDLTNIPNKKLLQDTFRYFLRLGLLEKADNSQDVYQASELGKEVFRRANSFYVPHSYFDYMYRYHEMIQSPAGTVKPTVERLENVIGSGITHLRYFPPVVSYMKRKLNFDVIVDIGCGDGHFLSTFLKSVPGKKVVGVDLSPLSTETTKKNLEQEYPGLNLTVVCSDALAVDKWGQEVKKVAGDGKVAISMWFLLHEISGNKPERLVKFFKDIHRLFPTAPIVVGEVVNQGDDVLVSNRTRSLLPEYLFFHEMSGQGILLWDEYREVLDKIPYQLQLEQVFDEAPDKNARKVPSTFVWGLVPK